ncbi:TetR/AcrR family transcriptional regulator [Andreprevotia chitinilytica]|uniref:TetR/AcrR family transcriptional regulator n=1 Tax=Andreprevotia chitinilytica TaxID=396808 RepID=UPI000A015AAE|nr:TetR/AcrR family transcriptional regulator [Andreprevotia chitinilytica]
MTGSTPSPDKECRTRGRPREFDVDEALDKAIDVFRERGYHGTSISDLSAAMELTAGSIYKAFKDKHAVFSAALERHITLRKAAMQAAIQTEKSGRDKVCKVLTTYATQCHGIEGRLGCLVVGSAIELAIFDEGIARQVNDSLMRNETMLAGLIKDGQADGSIAADIDGPVTARSMLCVLQGMRVLGKTGRAHEELLAVVDVAMKLLG